MAFDAHLQGLTGVRAALRLALAHRDRHAPAMAEVRELAVPSPHGALAARLYHPAGAAATGPALLFWHGGGFVLCDLETHDALCRRLAAAARAPVISARYRLAPEAPFPAQIDDGVSVARWVLANAAGLGLAPGRLLVGGDSAGGYVAVAVARAMACEAKIAGQVLIYPLLQLDDALWSATLIADARIVGRIAVGYIRAQLKPGDLAIPSLIETASPATPPTLVITGGPLDPCRPDARAYADGLEACGVTVTRLEYPPLPHGFGNLTHVLKRARQAVEEIGAATGALARSHA